MNRAAKRLFGGLAVLLSSSAAFAQDDVSQAGREVVFGLVGWGGLAGHVDHHPLPVESFRGAGFVGFGLNDG